MPIKRPVGLVVHVNPLEKLNPRYKHALSENSLYASPVKKPRGFNTFYTPPAAPRPPTPVRPGWSPAPDPQPDYKPSNWTYMPILEEDLDQAGSQDVLSIHTMAERFDRQRWITDVTVQDIRSEYQMTRNEAYMNCVQQNDRNLLICLTRANAPGYASDARSYWAECADRNRCVPHLLSNIFSDTPVEDMICAWIRDYTDTPEPDQDGIVSLDPYELRKFVPTTPVRESCSETNVVLGSRKRVADVAHDVIDVNVTDTASDTLLVEKKESLRPLGDARRRRIAKSMKYIETSENRNQNCD